MTQPHPRYRLVIAAAALALLTLSGCSALGPGESGPERNDAGEIVTAGKADIFALQVGDCLNNVENGQTTNADAVPCSTEHDLEVFSLHTITADDFDPAIEGYPGDDRVATLSRDACTAGFTEFIGVPPEGAEHSYFVFSPTMESWMRMNDRIIACTAHNNSGKTTGTLAGIGR